MKRESPTRTERGLIWLWPVLAGISSLAICYFGARLLRPPSVDQQNLYWVFTASAQSIAAFVAFLIAGYALFHSNMMEIASRDETVADVIEEEKRQNFARLKLLLIATGSSIGLNLLMVYLNDSECILKNELIILTFESTIIAIFLGITVVINMIDPKRNSKVAAHLIKISRQYDQEGAASAGQAFFTKFVELERLIRDFVTDDEKQFHFRTNLVPSLNEIYKQLHFRNVISRELYNRLVDITRYRNLLFHGEIRDASKKMIDELTELLEDMKIKLHKDRDMT